MIQADKATVEWNSEKRRWEVHIELDTEVVKRPISAPTADQAVAVARDEGYELNPANVIVKAQ